MVHYILTASVFFRLQVYGLYEVKVSGDGNCQVSGTGHNMQMLVDIVGLLIFVSMQFRALSDQMFKSPEYHKHVRKEVIKQVKML